MAFDLSQVTVREHESLFDRRHPVAEEREMMARVSGISVEEQLALSMLDHKTLWKAYFKAVREPLADPT